MPTAEEGAGAPSGAAIAPAPPAPPPPPPPLAPPRAPSVRAAPAAAITPDLLRLAKSNLKPAGVTPGPPVAFYFKVVFGESGMKDETSFQEVSGMGAEMQMEEVHEGGENRYVQRLPTGVRYQPLVLKRSIGPASSRLVKWCRAVLEGGLGEQIMTAPLTVYLLNAAGDPVRAWLFADAFPQKWEVESFHSTKNEVAIETITLTYSYSNRIA